MVPWVVMQELDALKTNAKVVGLKAKKAIHFLHGCFSSQHPRVRGQSMLEVGVVWRWVCTLMMWVCAGEHRV